MGLGCRVSKLGHQLRRVLTLIGSRARSPVRWSHLRQRADLGNAAFPVHEVACKMMRMRERFGRSQHRRNACIDLLERLQPVPEWVLGNSSRYQLDGLSRRRRARCFAKFPVSRLELG